jgi:dTDP-4-dehydrorhamnose reductase
MSKKVLILGVGGMLGRACFDYFDNLDEFETFGTWRKPTLDKIRAFDASKESIEGLIKDVEPDWVINCIGVIKQKIDENSQSSVENTLQINQVFPHQIAKAVQGSKIKVIQIATDCVFNGLQGSYSELSPHDASDLYGKSKSKGEVVSPEFLNLRVSIIGKEVESNYSLVSWFLSQKIGVTIDGYLNHLWNGITCRTFARIVSGIILNEKFVCGTFNIIPADQISKYELLRLLRKYFDRKDLSIRPINAPSNVDRTLRTINLNFNTAIWLNAGYEPIPTIEELIKELAKNP